MAQHRRRLRAQPLGAFLRWEVVLPQEVGDRRLGAEIGDRCGTTAGTCRVTLGCTGRGGRHHMLPTPLHSHAHVPYMLARKPGYVAHSGRPKRPRAPHT
eukprot:7382117-Prymnesium_polylepis.2